MTEETPGFEEKPDVPSGASEDAEPKAADSSEEGKAAPAGDAAKDIALQAQLDQAQTALTERTADLQRLQAEYQNYLSMHVDDVFAPDARWDTVNNCTPGDFDCPA
ncbi:hypothetical protein ABZ726_30895, partial [Streptomyces hundungensis]